MGTQFFWFYDIIVAAIIIGVVFKCAKKGFVSTIVGLLAVVIAFCLALFFSDGASKVVYESWVENNLKTEISGEISDNLGGSPVTSLGDIDMSKLIVGGKPLGELSTVPDSAGKINLDLSVMDYSETGMSKLDLTAFGINSDTDLTKMKLGTVRISQSELINHDLGEIILAKTLVSYMEDGTAYGQLAAVSDSIGKTFPQLFGANGSSESENSMLTNIVLGLINTSTSNISDAIVDNVVEPVILVPIRILIFIALFAIISIVLGLLARTMTFINKIPVIGGINILLGGILGILEAAITIFIICICLQFVISVTGDNLIFLNTVTIEQTFVFKYFYCFDPINFIGAAL